MPKNAYKVGSGLGLGVVDQILFCAVERSLVQLMIHDGKDRPLDAF
jgi:hypothetical protein